MKSYYVLIMSIFPQCRFDDLFYSVRNGDLGMVKFLVERGDDINVLNYENDNALDCSSRYGHLEMVKFLVENGIDINYVNKKFNDNALHTASWYGHFEIVKYLINKGINFNLRNINGKTALDFAVYNNHHDIVDFLQNYCSKKRELENKEFSENKKIRVN